MSKMKHLFRKLHIGGGSSSSFNDHHHRLHPDRRPLTGPQPPQTAPVSPSAASTSSSPPAATLARANSVETAVKSTDFSFFEEEFQVQLALAISLSDLISKVEIELNPDPDQSRKRFLGILGRRWERWLQVLMGWRWKRRVGSIKKEVLASLIQPNP